MSIIKERREVTETREVIIQVRCDLCGESAPEPWRKEDGWGASTYDVGGVHISCKEGESYPEGGSGITLSFQICPQCFKEKLVVWMQSQGAELTSEEWDW